MPNVQIAKVVEAPIYRSEVSFLDECTYVCEDNVSFCKFLQIIKKFIENVHYVKLLVKKMAFLLTFFDFMSIYATRSGLRLVNTFLRLVLEKIYVMHLVTQRTIFLNVYMFDIHGRNKSF